MTIDADERPAFLEFGAAITHSADRDGPDKVTIALRSSHPETVTIQFGYTPPLGGLTLSNPPDDTTIELWPDELYNEESIVDRKDDGELEVVPDERTNGCWTAVDRPTGPDTFESETFAPCDSLASTFSILAHPDNAGCLPTGDYERTDTVTVRDTGETFDVTLRLST